MINMKTRQTQEYLLRDSYHQHTHAHTHTHRYCVKHTKQTNIHMRGNPLLSQHSPSHPPPYKFPFASDKMLILFEFFLIFFFCIAFRLLVVWAAFGQFESSQQRSINSITQPSNNHHITSHHIAYSYVILIPPPCHSFPLALSNDEAHVDEWRVGFERESTYRWLSLTIKPTCS